MERHAEGLVENRGKPAAAQRARLVRAEALDGAVGKRDAHGHERVDADGEATALAKRERDVGGLADAAVDVVGAVDVNGAVETRDRARGRDRFGDRNGIESRRAEGRRLSGVEVHRDESEHPVQAPEVVGAACLREPLPHPLLEAFVLEESRRKELPERLNEVRQCRLPSVLVEVPGGVEHREGRGGEPGRDLAEVQAEEREVVDVRAGAGGARHVSEEEAGSDAVREQCGDVGPGGHADEDVEVGDRDVLEPVFEGRQGSDLVDGARDAPARADDSEASADGRRKGLEGALRESGPG